MRTDARWLGDFGRSYTERNAQSAEEIDAWHTATYGISRSALNAEFLAGLPLERVLEVGCNNGLQLRHLQPMTSAALYGVELQPFAVELAKTATVGINVIQGTAVDLPFKDGFFDLVFTSGVLVQMPPDEGLDRALDEIYRCSRRFILGMEFFSETPTEIVWRDQRDLLWKRDFAAAYRARFPDLALVKERRLPYASEPVVDQMFLLEKQTR